MGINHEKKEETNGREEVTVPNLVGLSLKEAQKITNEIGLILESKNIENAKNREEAVIIEQAPIEGIKIYKENKIFVKSYLMQTAE